MRAIANRRPAPLTKAAGDGYSGAERSVSRVINQGWEIMDTGLMQDRAMQMLAASSTEGFLNALPWTQFAEHLGQTVEPISGAVGKAINQELGTIGHAGAKLSLTSVDALSHKYAQEQAGTLIRNISDSQRATIRGILGRAQAGELTVDQTAREIRKGIGLHPAWANAVTNYQNRLDSQPAPKGYSPARWQQTIDKRVDRYREQLIRKRSYNIARTEIITAENLGRYATWAQAIGTGSADVNSRKEWAPGPGACKFCEALAGEIVAWDAPFSNGAIMPPAHPSCRCSANLLPPEYTNQALNPRNINWTDPAGDRAAVEDYSAGRGILDALSAEPAAAETVDEFNGDGSSDGADTYGQDTEPQAAEGIDAARIVVRAAERPTAAQLDALETYANNSDAINAAARSGDLTAHDAQIQNIDSAISRQKPITDPIKVFRGLTNADLPRDLIGTVYRENGFLSTSLRADAGDEFLTGAGDVKMEIVVPKGSRGVSIEHAVNGYGSAPGILKGEGEFLLPRGTAYEFVSDTTLDNGIRVIRANIIDAETAAAREAEQTAADIRTAEAAHVAEIPAAPQLSAYERDLQAMQAAATATKADQLTYETTLHWSDDKLMAQITKYEHDPEAMDRLFEIIDQRAAVEEAKLAAEEMAQASYNAEQAAKEAAAIDEAAGKAAGTLKTEEDPALNPARRPERNLNAYQQAGEEFQNYMYNQYNKALDATNGNFFNAANHAAAKKRGYDEIALFSGPFRIAKKYASEELLQFWETEGRDTLGSFRYRLLGRPSDRKAFDTVLREGLGRKAASYDRSNL